LQDGLCEINTFFLIARRHWKPLRPLFSFLYWVTFVPMRTALYPIMLVHFWREMQPYARWEALVVCGCQLLLIAFNLFLLTLSALNWYKRSMKAPAAPVASAASTNGAAAGGWPHAALGMHAHASVWWRWLELLQGVRAWCRHVDMPFI
jgi:hypothetical protein